MRRNRIITLFLFGIIAAVPFVSSCGGGGGGGSASLTPILLASVNNAGTQGNDASYGAAISGDGRYVLFSSWADNLVTGDTNVVRDAFVHDAVTGITSRVSVSTAGTQGNGGSYGTAISTDGRYLAFGSAASNLVLGDANSSSDIFRRDTLSGNEITSRMSVSTMGTEGNGSSFDPDMSGDGKYVVFASTASNLVLNDTNSAFDVFVHNAITGSTFRVSVSSGGTQGNGASSSPSISSDGRYVAFSSSASNLVTNDPNGFSDIFVRDIVSGTTTLISVSSTGTAGNGDSDSPSISSDGRFVAFESKADSLAAGDANGADDIFVRDTLGGTTYRVSVSTAGVGGNSWSIKPAISGDGRYVVFRSFASNLVAGDNNVLEDIFIRDTSAGTTSRVSVSESGVEADGDSQTPAINSDGSYIAFESTSTNLIDGKTLSGMSHVFRAPRP